MPTNSSSPEDPSKLLFDSAYNQTNRCAFLNRFHPINLFHSPCHNFYREVEDQVIITFDYSDNVFPFIKLVMPQNARRLAPKSLRCLFERFPELSH